MLLCYDVGSDNQIKMIIIHNTEITAYPCMHSQLSKLTKV